MLADMRNVLCCIVLRRLHNAQQAALYTFRCFGIPVLTTYAVLVIPATVADTAWSILPLLATVLKYSCPQTEIVGSSVISRPSTAVLKSVLCHFMGNSQISFTESRGPARLIITKIGEIAPTPLLWYRFSFESNVLASCRHIPRMVHLPQNTTSCNFTILQLSFPPTVTAIRRTFVGNILKEAYG